MTTRLPIRVSAVEYSRPVGKLITLDEQSRITKTVDPSVRASSGVMRNLAFFSPADAFDFRLSASPELMFLTGTFDPCLEGGTVVSASQLDHVRPRDKHTTVAATKEFLAFREGAGLLPIDIDFKRADETSGIYPAECGALQAAEDVHAALLQILPEAQGSPMLVTPSSSSMIVRTDDNLLVAGAGGWRVLIPITDAREIPRVLSVIHQRCWARELFRYAFVSRGGSLLFRSLADQALSRPTQPDFPTPILGTGLKRLDASVRVNLAGDYLNPTTVSLSAEELDRARTNMERARIELRPEIQRVERDMEAATVAELGKRGLSADRAKAVASARRSGVILPDDLIEFADGEVAQAVHLMGPAGEAFDQRPCLDPVEPRYDGGRPVARFYWNEGKTQFVHSFAHGSTTFRLAFDRATASDRIEGLFRKEDIIDVLARTVGSDLDLDLLEGAAARQLKLGARRMALRAEIRQRRDAIAYHSQDDHDGLVAPRASFSAALDKDLPILGEKQQPLDHHDNIAALLSGYEISYRYNLITKDFEWSSPLYARNGDHADESLFSVLVGLCALNSVPTKHLQTHLMLLGSSHSWNPVTDFLQQLKWDGVERFHLVADALGASDLRIARIAVRILLIEACAAADHGARVMALGYRPCFETVVVLAGAQGSGKTKGIRKLLPAELQRFYKESVVLNLHDKDSRKQATSWWIVELGELDSTFRKSDIIALKAFLSDELDEMRLPYAHTTSRFERRTTFLGTVNEMEFLSDATGARRYIPLSVGEAKVALTEVVLLHDLPPANRTILSWNFPFMIPWPGAGEFHEDVEVHRGSDRLCAQAG